MDAEDDAEGGGNCLAPLLARTALILRYSAHYCSWAASSCRAGCSARNDAAAMSCGAVYCFVAHMHGVCGPIAYVHAPLVLYAHPVPLTPSLLRSARRNPGRERRRRGG